MSFDSTGKVSLDHIYTQPDPRGYFSTLSKLGYCIPQLAKPYFEKLIEASRHARGEPVKKVLDIGCSYGINAALLKCDLSMDDLYARYGSAAAAERSTAELLAADQALLARKRRFPQTRFVGLDVSAPALRYGADAGYLDDGIQADLEQQPADPQTRARLSGSDLVISTGCLGYVTDKTLLQVLAAQGDRRPIMAHFVLRMFPFDSLQARLRALDYETNKVGQVFKQRRFASAREQEQILDTLADVRVDPKGLESEGWLYAHLYVSRPRDQARRLAWPEMSVV